MTDPARKRGVPESVSCGIYKSVSPLRCSSSRTPTRRVGSTRTSKKFHFRIHPPWDLLRGRCVFKHRDALVGEVNDSDLSHFAPNCATFSRAREIPIRGVRNCPRPVRNESCPQGIPSEVEALSKRGRKRLADDTEMADLSANFCLERANKKKGFTLEHPGNSIALHLPSWKRLIDHPDVRVVYYHTCMFEGSRRRKYQVLITNRAEFVAFIGRKCTGSVCQRTGLEHLRWRPTVSGGQVVQFQTGDEREYPLGFCEQYAQAAKEVLKDGGVFVEVPA